MTLALELGGIQNPDILRAFEQVSTQFPLRGSNLANDVLLLAVTGTSRKVAFGVNTVTWPGGVSLSTELTVTHGLGATPVVVLATMQASGQGEVVACHAGAYGGTTFKVQAEFVAGFAPGAAATLPVAWLAVG